MTNTELANQIINLSDNQKLYWNKVEGNTYLASNGTTLTTPDKSDVDELIQEYDAKSSADKDSVQTLVDGGDDILSDFPC